MNANKNKEIERLYRKDSKYEGRDRYFMDVERMISGGLANGTVITRHEKKQIEETIDLTAEEPPQKAE
ncbi:hypothetical protein [Calidifontibacillus oryziterrae]|uniref:hypothetical protein n=1 Tax=Calidifontibacillus oryziterrae TaxID=1191699 RepID=UPI00030C2CDD|nr:hypothetical protein [Calidifontibacillus oryziterrae]